MFRSNKLSHKLLSFHRRNLHQRNYCWQNFTDHMKKEIQWWAFDCHRNTCGVFFSSFFVGSSQFVGPSHTFIISVVCQFIWNLVGSTCGFRDDGSVSLSWPSTNTPTRTVVSERIPLLCQWWCSHRCYTRRGDHVRGAVQVEVSEDETSATAVLPGFAYSDFNRAGNRMMSHSQTECCREDGKTTTFCAGLFQVT